MINRTLIICLVFTGSPIIFAQPVKTDSRDNRKVTELKLSVEPLLQLSLMDVKSLVPSVSGLNSIGCPNYHGGGINTLICQIVVFKSGI